jgi:hypothetical protein
LDARAPEARFRLALIRDSRLSDYPGSYPQDHHYDRHGFGFIETEADIDAFLMSLDEAALLYSSGCIKARVLRSDMLRRWEWTDAVTQFKALAARARRCNCRCHDTGSYAINEVEAARERAFQALFADAGEVAQ